MHYRCGRIEQLRVMKGSAVVEDEYEDELGFKIAMTSWAPTLFAKVSA